MVNLIRDERSLFIWKRRDYKMNKNKKTKILGAGIIVFIGLLFWFFGNDSNKYVLEGEVTKCSFDNTFVLQFLDQRQDSLPEYFDNNGKKIACDGSFGDNSNKCEIFLDSLNDCGVIYRSFEEDKASRVYTTEEETIIPIIIEAKRLDF